MKKKPEISFIIMKAIQWGLLFIAAVIIIAAIADTSESSGEEGRRQLEESLHRAIMACYASEGIYPEDIDYLKDHYGLFFNEGKYSVHYEVFAQNLMPEITVLENKNER